MAEKILSVDDFLATLDTAQRSQVVNLRRIILAAAPELTEHIKWNSPSYVHDGIDRVTINVRNREHVVQLIFHMDTARPEDRNAPPVMTDETGLIRWLSDIRGVIPLAPTEAVDDKTVELSTAITQWLAIS